MPADQRIVAAVTGADHSSSVRAFAQRLADALRVGLHLVEMPEGEPAVPTLGTLAADPATLAVVLGPGGTAFTLVQRGTTPVVVVPAGLLPQAPLARVLVVVDRPEAVDSPLLTFLAAAGIEVVALHVFEPGNAPPYWDQPHHEVVAWGEEFGARVGSAVSTVITRSGRPGEHMVDAAVDEGVDLLLIPWHQDSGAGGSALVRASVEHTPMPVMLMPGM